MSGISSLKRKGSSMLSNEKDKKIESKSSHRKASIQNNN